MFNDCGIFEGKPARVKGMVRRIVEHNGQVYEPCGITHGQSNEVHSNNFKIFLGMEKIKVKIPEKCKDCVYVNKKGNCWALKDKCNPNSMNCDYRKDEK